MPRAPNGDYTLPAGNPLVPGTVITADWANDTMDDLGNEITNSLSRNGQGGMLVPLRFIGGGQAQPGISWTEEFSTGFYLASAAPSSDMRVSVFGLDKMRFTTLGVDVFVDGQFERVLSGDLDADLVNYDIANQNIITIDQVQGALDQLSLGLEGAISGISFQGNWDSDQGIPPSLSPEGGQMWVVSVAGNTPLPPAGGGTDLDDWQLGERVIYVDLDVDPGWVRLSAVQGVTAFIVSFVPIGTQVPSDNVQLAIQDVNNRINDETALVNENNTFTAQNIFNNVPQSLEEPLTVGDLTRKDYVDAQIQTRALTGGNAANTFTVANSTEVFHATRKDYVDAADEVLSVRIIQNADDIDTLESDLASLDASAIDFEDVPVPPEGLPYENVQTGLFAALYAEGTRFDPSGSPLNDINVQDAIDTLALFLQSLVSGLQFRGTWDASDGDQPDDGEIAAGPGDFWIIDVAGTTELVAWEGGVLDDWVVGDRAIYLDNAGGTGYFQLAANTVLPANQILFNDFTFLQFLPTLPPPENVQEALDILWEPISLLIIGGVIRQPIALAAIDLDTLGDPNDHVGWYYKDAVPGGGLNYPVLFGGNLRIVQVGGGSVAQSYVTNTSPAQNWTRRSLNDGDTWSDWEQDLSLAGGTMLGDITLSNGLSVNTVTSDADAGNIGKTEFTSTDLNNGVAGFFRDGANSKAYIVFGRGSDFSNSFYMDSNTGSELVIKAEHYNSGTGVTYTGEWDVFASDTRTSAEANALLDEIATGFLPLTGGTLTGSSGILTLQKAIPTQTTSWLQFNDSAGVRTAYIGYGEPSTLDLFFAVEGGGEAIISSSIAINLNAPITNVSGQIKGITPVAAEDLTRKDYVDNSIASRVNQTQAGIGLVGTSATSSVVVFPEPFTEFPTISVMATETEVAAADIWIGLVSLTQFEVHFSVGPTAPRPFQWQAVARN